MTPAETADEVEAYKRRENRRLIHRAWELSLLMAPHAKEGSDMGTIALFKSMPGAFPDAAKEFLEAAQSPREKTLSPEKEAERARRRAIPRIQRPR